MFNTKKILLSILFGLMALCVKSQTAWPSVGWSSATNISANLPTSAAELSGLYWNDELNCLYVVGDGGYVYLLELNNTTKKFSLIGSASSIDGPEGITQVNNIKNEFYTLDENSYEIRKYNFNAGYNAVTKIKSWSLLKSPSPMTDTDNTGPEGIAFVPDSYLQYIGFISSVSGKAYTSTKGMGGLMFIAHQDEGWIWVFDINPNTNNDFAYVGKYKSNRSESCDLAFDKSTGMLYILHNLDDNYLEVTDLTTTKSSSNYKLNTIAEYNIPNPSGTINVEGVAISSKYPQATSSGAWLCRDVKSTETTDAIRWFSTFVGVGSQINTGIELLDDDRSWFKIYPNPVADQFSIICNSSDIFSYKLLNTMGQVLISRENVKSNEKESVQSLENGIYYLAVTSGIKKTAFKIIVNRP